MLDINLSQNTAELTWSTFGCRSWMSTRLLKCRRIIRFGTKNHVHRHVRHSYLVVKVSTESTRQRVNSKRCAVTLYKPVRLTEPYRRAGDTDVVILFSLRPYCDGPIYEILDDDKYRRHHDLWWHEGLYAEAA